jgi:ABC-2 type transport system permease protein
MTTTTANATIEPPGAKAAAQPGGSYAARYRGGWRIVARKELADHLHSVRFLILLVLVALAGLAAVHAASGPLRDAADDATQSPSAFLLLFTLSPDRVPAFHELIGILGPLLGIAFGFDAVNAERSQRTLPRLVSQPVHRDEILNGKFVAASAAIALVLGCVVTIVAGYGALRIGLGPTGSDVVRLAGFWSISVIYVAFWLAVSLLLSVVTRRAATAALAAIALWLVLTVFAGLIAGGVADTFRDLPDQPSAQQVLDKARFELNVRRLSPDQLYSEATGVLLNPARQSTGILVLAPEDLALPSALSLEQSLLLAWWQLVALVAGTVVVFVVAYIAFMRQEIRA